jgi:hypothetical protein
MTAEGTSKRSAKPRRALSQQLVDLYDHIGHCDGEDKSTDWEKPFHIP